MKKLMIAATIAALAGASFADCNEKCPFAYRMKVMVRTTLSGAVNDTATCNEGCYRKPSIRRFIGFIYGKTEGSDCDGCKCNDWVKGANVALWDFDARKGVNFTGAELFLLDRVGYQQTDKCEMAFEFNTFETCMDPVTKKETFAYGALIFSGFGSTGIHEGNVTVGAVAGYCAGYLPAFCTTKDAKTCTESCSISKAWELCSANPITPPFTAAYGKWTLVWDSGAAAQVNTGALKSDSARIDGVPTKPVQMGDIRNYLK